MLTGGVIEKLRKRQPELNKVDRASCVVSTKTTYLYSYLPLVALIQTPIRMFGNIATKDAPKSLEELERLLANDIKVKIAGLF